MRISFQRIIGFCMCLLCFPLFAQQYKAVIPYKMVGRKMVIEMKMNDKECSFIFDTGGRTALTTTTCRLFNLSATDSMRVTDANNATQHYPTTVINSLMMPDNSVNFRHVPALIIDEVTGWKCFGADGIIGSDLFRGSIVSIDSKQKIITVTSAEKPSTVSLRKMLNFAKPQGMPIITTQIAPAYNLPVLFDTGNPELLSLSNNNLKALLAEGAVSIKAEGHGEGSFGVAGQAKDSIYYRISIPEYRVGATGFSDLTVEAGNHPYTLLGVDLLKYGKVTIDYPRHRFYFEAYQPENVIKNQCSNLDLTIKEGDLVISKIWDKTLSSIKVGDKVVKINGKTIGKLDFCEGLLNGIPALKEKKKTKLTVQTAGGLKEIPYNKD